MNQKSMSLQQFLLYLTIVSAFMGTLWMSVEVGPIHMFPYRIFLIFMWFLFVGNILFINNGRLNLSHIKVKLYLKFLSLWLAYAFISIMWAAEKVDALKNIIFLFTGISIVFSIVYYLRDINDLKRLYWLWILIFVALIPVGIWEVTTGNHLIMSNLLEEDRAWVKFAPTTVFTNQNDFAAYIALSLPMVLMWIRYHPKLYSRVLGTLVFILGLFLLISTLSRSCYIAVLAGLVFWLIFLLKVKKKIKFLAVSAFICVFVIFAFPDETMIMKETIETQMLSLSSLSLLSDSATFSDDVRENLIKNALYFTAKSAGFGVGAGNAEYYMDRYKIYPVGQITNVHNWWAEIIVNYGVFIFAGYVILYIATLLNLWRAYHGLIGRAEKMICEALLVGWVSFFMASISSSSIMAFSPQWIYFGFILAFLNYVRIRKKSLLRCIS